MSKTLLEEGVEQQIQLFDDYFQSIADNDPLSPSERAIIKTFCWYLFYAAKEIAIPGMVIQHEDPGTESAGIPDSAHTGESSND